MNQSDFTGDGLDSEPIPTAAEEADVTQTESTPDLQTLIQNEVAKAVGSLAQPQSFEEILAQVDPRDSDSALAMLDWLVKTGRLNRIAVLDGGGGYLFMYGEPKGSSKAGYTPGATQGDRIVDQAVDAQRAAGAAPTKRGVCQHCISAVAEVDGKVVSDNEERDQVCTSSPTGAHQMA